MTTRAGIVGSGLICSSIYFVDADKGPVGGHGRVYAMPNVAYSNPAALVTSGSSIRYGSIMTRPDIPGR